jgi:Holliday junction resolvase RusA-like endonuclease
MRFTIPGPPAGKARHRTGKGRAYTPRQTLMYENAVKYAYLESGGKMLDGPVELMILAYYSIPKSASRKRHALMLAGEIRPTVRPDWDNIGKIVCDAINGIAYRDDACVTDATVRKRYAENPRVEVEIREV